MLIGFGFGPAPTSFGVLGASGAAVSEMWHTTTQTITGFGRALTNRRRVTKLSSIVGITQDVHEQVKRGPGFALVFLGFLSLVLAVINLFPFLPLDGGHVLWAVAEKVRGRRISLLAMYRFSSVGIVLLLFLVINGVEQRHQPPDRLTQTQLLASGPKRSARAAPNSASSSRRRSSEMSSQPPVAPSRQ